jgi:hypothetical protein
VTDDYPSDETLATIRDWPGDDDRALLAFVKARWWMADWGWCWHEYDGVMDRRGRPMRVYLVSTGGWSGNESLIEALRASRALCWMRSWYAHRRGGHYEFRVEAHAGSAPH